MEFYIEREELTDGWIKNRDKKCTGKGCTNGMAESIRTKVMNSQLNNNIWGNLLKISFFAVIVYPPSLCFQFNYIVGDLNINILPVTNFKTLAVESTSTCNVHLYQILDAIWRDTVRGLTLNIHLILWIF